MTPFEKDLINLTLADIFSRYFDIEESIHTSALFDALATLPGTRPPSGKIIYIEESPYYIDMSVSKVERAINIAITPLRHSRSKPEVLTAEIKEVGIIRHVSVCAPKTVKRTSNRILRTICESLRRKYSYLESAFLAEYNKTENVIIYQLDDIIRTEFRNRDAEKYLNSAHLSITSLSDGKYRYYVNRKMAEILLERFKLGNCPAFSALAAVITMAAGSATDSFIREGLSLRSGFVIMSFDSVETKIENPELWKVELSLYKSSNLAVTEICQEAGFSIQFNCPPASVDRVKPIIDSIRGDLHDQLKQNLEQFNIQQSNWRKLCKNVLTRSEKIEGTKEFIATIAAKSFGELVSAILKAGQIG